MNFLTNANIKNIFDQNFQYYLKKNYKHKKAKASEIKRLKYKIYFEAQNQLYFSKVCCVANSIEEEIKLSHLQKLYKRIKQGHRPKKNDNDDFQKCLFGIKNILNSSNTTTALTNENENSSAISLNLSSLNSSTNSEITLFKKPQILDSTNLSFNSSSTTTTNTSTTSVDDHNYTTQNDNIKIIKLAIPSTSNDKTKCEKNIFEVSISHEAVETTTSGYVSSLNDSDTTNNSNENSIINKIRTDEEHEHDDYLDLVNNVFNTKAESTRLESNVDIESKILQPPKLEIQTDDQQQQPERQNIRRTSRHRPPVLYSENLTNIRYSNGASTPALLNSIDKKPKKNDSNSTNVSSSSSKPMNISSSEATVASSSFTYNNEDEILYSGTLNIGNTPIHCEKMLTIQKLPRTRKSNVEIHMPKTFSNTISLHPLSIKVHLNEIDLSQIQNVLNDNNVNNIDQDETTAAVAAITGDYQTVLKTEIKNEQQPKRARKSRAKNTTQAKKPKTKLSSKSDLAKFIESFGDGTNHNSNDAQPDHITIIHRNQNNNHPYQSPQNAGVSTTTGEVGNGSELWTLIPNSNSLINAQNQQAFIDTDMEVELVNENFNLINYIANENVSMPSTSNIIQGSSNNQTTIINSSPRDISSTTTPAATIDMNHIFLHQALPSVPPQPTVKNYYDKSLLKNIHLAPVDNIAGGQYQVINGSLPDAHSSSHNSLYKTTQANSDDVIDLTALDLRKRTKFIDLNAKQAKQEQITENTSRENSSTISSSNQLFPKQRVLTFYDYKSRQLDNNINNKTIKGPDMPLLFDDALNNSNNKYKLNNDIESIKTDIIVMKNELQNSNDSITPNGNSVFDFKNKIENVDVKKIELIENKENISSVEIDQNECPAIVKKSNSSELNHEKIDENDDENEKKMNNEESAKNNESNNNVAIVAAADEERKNLELENRSACSSKSKDDIDGCKLLDDFLTMKDNAELDYEHEIDLDCLQLHTSPQEFDFDEDEINIKTKKDKPIEVDDKSNNDSTKKTDKKPITMKLPVKTSNVSISNNAPAPKSPLEINQNNSNFSYDIFGIRINNEDLPSSNHTDKKLQEYKIPKIIKTTTNDNQTTANTTLTVTETQVPSSSAIASTTLSSTNLQKIIRVAKNFDSNQIERQQQQQQPPPPPQKLRCWPDNPTNILKPQPTSTITSSLSSSSSVGSASSKNNETFNNSNVNRPAIGASTISQVFGSPCFNFLADNCFEIKCRFKHTLIEQKEMKLRLAVLSDQYLELAYKFLMRYYKLFRNYFEIFCEIFSDKNNHDMLKKCILYDCQKFANSSHLLKPVMKAFIKIGYTNNDALQLILDNLNDNTPSTIHNVIDLIIDTSPICFLSTLERYSNLNNFHFQMRAINKLATICIKDKHYDLMQFLVQILSCVPHEQLYEEKSDDLIKFLELVKDLNISPIQIPNTNTNIVATSSCIKQQRVIHNVDNNLTMMLNQQQPQHFQNLFPPINQQHQHQQMQQQNQTTQIIPNLRKTVLQNYQNNSFFQY